MRIPMPTPVAARENKFLAWNWRGADWLGKYQLRGRHMPLIELAPEKSEERAIFESPSNHRAAQAGLDPSSPTIFQLKTMS